MHDFSPLVFQGDKMKNHLQAFVHKNLPAEISVVGRQQSLEVFTPLAEKKALMSRRSCSRMRPGSAVSEGSILCPGESTVRVFLLGQSSTVHVLRRVCYTGAEIGKHSFNGGQIGFYS